MKELISFNSNFKYLDLIPCLFLVNPEGQELDKDPVYVVVYVLVWVSLLWKMFCSRAAEFPRACLCQNKMEGLVCRRIIHFKFEDNYFVKMRRLM